MDISIGTSPDFKMTRGKEILGYAASIEISKPDLPLIRRIEYHFSLVMLCKNALEIGVANQSIKSKFKLEVTTGSVEISSIDEHDSPTFTSTFKLPLGLTLVQARTITSFISRFFKVSKATSKI